MDADELIQLIETHLDEGLSAEQFDLLRARLAREPAVIEPMLDEFSHEMGRQPQDVAAVACFDDVIARVEQETDLDGIVGCETPQVDGGASPEVD